LRVDEARIVGDYLSPMLADLEGLDYGAVESLTVVSGTRGFVGVRLRFSDLPNEVSFTLDTGNAPDEPSE
jgi:hypothetical protein